MVIFTFVKVPKYSSDVTRTLKASEFQPLSCSGDLYKHQMIPQLNLSAGSSLNSDAPGYGQMSQSLEWYDCDQTRRTENETCCWFSKLLPAGNKMVDLQGVSAMWVNRLKEQREHRICKSLLSYF